jgi:hypothetical protein
VVSAQDGQRARARPGGGHGPPGGPCDGGRPGSRRVARLAVERADLRICEQAVSDACGPVAGAGWADAVAVMREHAPARPTWECSACGAGWPCAPLRAAMPLVMAPRQLRVIMYGALTDAARDMPGASPLALHERFLAWTYR